MTITTKFSRDDRVLYGKDIGTIVGVHCRMDRDAHIHYSVRFPDPVGIVPAINEQELVAEPVTPTLPAYDAPWSRDHDRLIAERLEDAVNIFHAEGDIWRCDIPQWRAAQMRDGDSPFHKPPPITEVPHYNTDLVAIVRACETAVERKDIRQWWLRSARHTLLEQIYGSCPDYPTNPDNAHRPSSVATIEWMSWSTRVSSLSASATTPAEALARAAYRWATEQKP